MTAGTAVELNAITRLVPTFNPEYHTFTVQLWRGYDLTDEFGLEPDCYTHEDDVIDDICDFLERHGLELLTPLQERALGEELIMAKGGADAELLRQAKQNPATFLRLF
jgi:hypothetical protein